MPKTYKNKSLVSGLSIEDILTMGNKEFNTLNEKDLRKVVGRLVSAGNKRARRLMGKDMNTPAVENLLSSGGLLSTKGKTFGELRSEYKRAKAFLKAKSSTVKGVSAINKKLISKFKENGVTIKNSNELVNALRLYNEMKKRDPSLANRSMRYTVIEEAAKISDKLSFDEAITELNARLEKLYEESVPDEPDDISEFFDIEGDF